MSAGALVPPAAARPAARISASDYGRDMEQVFRDQHREAAARGRLSVARVWTGERRRGRWRSVRASTLAQLAQDVALRAARHARQSRLRRRRRARPRARHRRQHRDLQRRARRAAAAAAVPRSGRLVSVWNRWDGARAAGAVRSRVPRLRRAQPHADDRRDRRRGRGDRRRRTRRRAGQRRRDHAPTRSPCSASSPRWAGRSARPTNGLGRARR